MIQTYTIIAIVGFALAAVLAVTAIIMFFALHIKQVHDDLTGKTAARSIVAIRSRAKTRARKEPHAAQRLGWEHEPSSAELAGFAQAVEMPFLQDDKDATTMFSFGSDSGSEGATTMISLNTDSEDESATTMISTDAYSEDEGKPTMFSFGADSDNESATAMLASPDIYDVDEAPTAFLGGMDVAPFPGGVR